MMKWWMEVKDNAAGNGYVAYDVTKVGHGTGTGFLDFSGQVSVIQSRAVGERETKFITTFVGHHFQLYDTKPNEDALANEMIHEVIVPNHSDK